MDNTEGWQRLATRLIARRGALGYSRRRAPFAKERGLKNDRVLFDLEKARRDTYDASTLAQVEQVYEWEAGSIAEVLAGGEPTAANSILNHGPGPHDSGLIQDPEAPIEAFTDEHLLAIVSERIGEYRRHIATLEARLEIYERTHGQREEQDRGKSAPKTPPSPEGGSGHLSVVPRAAMLAPPEGTGKEQRDRAQDDAAHAPHPEGPEGGA